MFVVRAAALAFCDANHNQPHQHGGATDPDNCGLFRRRHHRLKTFTRWTWRRAADGAIGMDRPARHHLGARTHPLPTSDPPDDPPPDAQPGDPPF